MIQFFRRIRQQLLGENKFTKYLIYAIGEIFLVVIGILIALQINNWNESNKLHQREVSLLRELKSNLEVNVDNLNRDISIQEKSYQDILRIIDHADKRKPYNDSLPKFLREASYAPDVILTASAFETLKSAGLELIRSDTLRRAIITLFEVDYPFLMQETKRLEDQVWPAVVVPLFQKHFRSVNETFVPNNYEAWLDDAEFFNMLSFRGALRRQSTKRKTHAAQRTKEVIQLIDKELE